jgi:calcyphosin
MKFFDTDGDGNISYEEFLKGLRDPLSERRLKIVDKAFRQLDREGSGTITVSDIVGIYEVSSNKDFISGKKSRE